MYEHFLAVHDVELLANRVVRQLGLDLRLGDLAQISIHLQDHVEFRPTDVLLLQQLIQKLLLLLGGEIVTRLGGGLTGAVGFLGGPAEVGHGDGAFLGHVGRSHDDADLGRFLLHQIQLHQVQQDVQSVSVHENGFEVPAGDLVAANRRNDVVLGICHALGMRIGPGHGRLGAATGQSQERNQ